MKQNPSATQADFKVPCPKCKSLCVFDKQKNPYRPFCSDRCQTLDLGTWANEDYRIAAENTDLMQSMDDVTPNADKIREDF